MSKFVRSSKVRHVFGDAAKPEGQFHGLRLASSTGDQNYIKANQRYFAVTVTAGGGSLAVFDLEKPGKLPPTVPVFDGHRGAVFDFDFNPFHQNLIVSGGDDCTAKLWQIPSGGLTTSIKEPVMDLIGHQKKVNHLRWHPTADNVLATGSGDHTVKVWDVQRGDVKATFEVGNFVNDVVWNYDGSMMASSSKDKLMRLMDPRTGDVVSEVEAHTGTKTSKLVYLGDTGRLVSVGFTRQSKRQFKVWDPKMLDKPLGHCDIDQSAGALMPFYDEGTKILYLAGKGDANIRYYEMTDSEPYQFKIADYRGGKPAKGMAMCPKLSCDVMKHEVTRLLKLTNDAVEPIHFTCPRKAELFQADLFPPAYAGKVMMSQDEFFGGKNMNPATVSLNPEDNKENQKEIQKEETFVVKKSATELQQELNLANKYIGILTKELEKNSISVPDCPKSA